jgi:hypothetical protein
MKLFNILKKPLARIVIDGLFITKWYLDNPNILKEGGA